MPKFRKKPVEIEAFQLPAIDEDASEELLDFLRSVGRATERRHNGSLLIHTLEGVMEALPGDWIIKGVKGELYPCKPDIFKETYEPCEDGGGTGVLPEASKGETG